MVSQIMASITGTARGAKQGSCRPSILIEAVGLRAMRKVIGLPLVMPP